MKTFGNTKRILVTVLLMSVIILTVIGMSFLEYRAYTVHFNQKLNDVYGYLYEKDNSFDGQELLDVLTNKEGQKVNNFLRYGIDINENTILEQNDRKLYYFCGINCVCVLFFCFCFLYMTGVREKKRKAELDRIARYLKNINAGDYSFDMDASKEGEMSLLETEVYKTTIMLREAAENSRADKERLKESLSDISHQLKTPLTSLMINLDNLEMNTQMEPDLRTRLIHNAKRDTNRLSMMVKQLLTLSKFDANVIEFKKEECSLKNIVSEAVENVEALAELKGIEILLENEKDAEASVVVDRYWQVQAISNILKNGLEHAMSRVTITYMNYELHKEIRIKNDGNPVSEKDRKNMFERFYSGENSTADSVGIGLALAHAVVRQDGGYISVESDVEKPECGVTFVVKYM